MSYMITRYLSLICGLTLSASAAFALTLEWKPVDPADLSLKEPRVEKDAGAEAIFGKRGSPTSYTVWILKPS